MRVNLQGTFASKSICFGCGPANPRGLHIESMADLADATGGSEVTATFTPRPEYEAFPGVLNGGIIGAILDCHSNWTAAWHLQQTQALSEPPCTVTADYAIKLLRPTPTDGPVFLSAKVTKSDRPDRATVEATLSAGGKICATCTGTFVAVKPGHPAYHRW